MCGTYNSTRDTHFNSSVDDESIDYFDIPINDEDERENDIPTHNRDN